MVILFLYAAIIVLCVPDTTSYLTTSSIPCGGRLDVQNYNVHIHSPSYPPSNPTYVDCTWVLSTSPYYKVKIHFSNFNIETCTARDYVDIYSGEIINDYNKIAR